MRRLYFQILLKDTVPVSHSGLYLRFSVFFKLELSIVKLSMS